MVNRIPNCCVLTNKLGLLTSLQRYEQVLTALRLSRVVKLKMSDFVPETYRLDDSFEQRMFLEAFKRAFTQYYVELLFYQATRHTFIFFCI